MIKYCLFALFALSATTLSCKKSDPAPTPPATEKFMSLTAGSIWNYKRIDSPSAPLPAVTLYTLTASSRDSTANAKTYKVFTSSDGVNQYYNITGNDYFTYRTLPASFGGTSIEVLYLKDNLSVNGTWSQSTPITVATFPLILTLNNKIAQKGISKTVNGIAYNNVTDVETTLSVTGIPNFVTYSLTSDIHYYYAPKVGEIENKIKIDFIVISGVPGVDPLHFEQRTQLENSTIL